MRILSTTSNRKRSMESLDLRTLGKGNLNGPKTKFRLIIDNIARGYKALYDQRIVHRDIKPQNILVKYDGTTDQLISAKITDFGEFLAHSGWGMINLFSPPMTWPRKPP